MEAWHTRRLQTAMRPRPQPSARFEALVLDFLAHLEFERGLSRNTLAAYRTDLLQFGGFLAERERDATDATARDLSDFLAELAEGDGNGREPCSTATIHRKAACLRSFYRHLRREELVDDDPAAQLATPRRGKKLPEVLSYAEVQKLLAQPRGSEPTDLRDRALLELMYASGLRASETISLEVGDVDLEHGVLRARGKGSKERLVPVGGKAVAAVRVYLRSGRPQLVARHDERKLFLNFRGGPLTRQGLYKIVLRHAESAGPRRADEPAHAAPLLRHPPADRRLRPALGPGDARPRRPLDHPALHPPLGRGAEGGLLQGPSQGARADVTRGQPSCDA